MSDLNFSILNSKDIIEDHLEILDSISNDIRLLEKTLKKAALLHDVVYKCDNFLTLKWCYDRQRLMAFEKPLIEQKIHIRVYAHKFLADFFEYTMKTLKELRR